MLFIPFDLLILSLLICNSSFYINCSFYINFIYATDALSQFVVCLQVMFYCHNVESWKQRVGTAWVTQELTIYVKDQGEFRERFWTI